MENNKTNTTANTTDIIDTNTQESATVITNKEEAMKMEAMKMERANRIAVQTTPTGYRADFYRTHKKLATLISEESGWEADDSLNKSAQRESFRQFAIAHSAEIGIEWKPQDLRSEENKRIPKYTTDEVLMEDATDMLTADMLELVAKCPHGIQYTNLTADLIIPVTHSAKGTDLTKLGVIDGKYEKSGNWAWAEVEMTLTLAKDGEEIYYSTKVQLVSGQLKKPHITQTSFNESIKESLKEVGLWVEESKEEPKAEPVEVAEAVTEDTTEEKPKKTTKKSSKKSK